MEEILGGVFNGVEMSSGSVFSYRPRDGKDPELTGRTRGGFVASSFKDRRGTKKLQETKKKAEEEHDRELIHVSANTKRDFRRTESSVIATAAMTSDPAGLDLQFQLSKPPQLHNIFFSFCPSVRPALPPPELFLRRRLFRGQARAFCGAPGNNRDGNARVV